MPIFLETSRLRLRHFTEDDAGNLFSLKSDPEVMRFLTGGTGTPMEEIRHQVIPFMLGFYDRYDGLGYWAAEAAAGGDFLGWFHFRPTEDGDVDLGYRLRRAVWNQGYATEGARALIGKGFTALGVQRVVAGTMAVNTASRRVLEKCGLTFVRTIYPSWLPAIEGSGHGAVEYELTRQAWQATTAGRHGA